MFHAGTVLGRASPAAEALLDPAYPRVLVAGELRATPQTGWVPSNLGSIVVLVAQRLAEMGHALQAGDLVLAGSYTPPLPLAAGDSVLADFGALGSVSITFA
jgi:2-oxo-hept-3-ene-1,7-dioate hydratase